MSPAHAKNPPTFDLCIEVAPTARNRPNPRPGATYMVHESNKATPAGALAAVGTWLSDSERKRVYSVRVQLCPGPGGCWYEGVKQE